MVRFPVYVSRVLSNGNNSGGFFCSVKGTFLVPKPFLPHYSVIISGLKTCLYKLITEFSIEILMSEDKINTTFFESNDDNK